MIARSHKGLSTTQHRILLGLSIFDLISSLGWSTFGSTTPSDNNYLVWNARGNEASCTIQGFFLCLGSIGGLWYNAMLNVYYVAVVNFGKSEDYIRTKIEPFLHSMPIVVALTFSIIVKLVGNHLNDGGYGNCITAVHHPPHCQGYGVGDVRDGYEIPCYRGSEGADTSQIVGMAVMLIPAVIIIVSLVSIYRAVKTQENKLKKYGMNTSNPNSSSLWMRIKTSLSRRSPTSTNTHPAIRSNNMQSQSRAVMQKAFQYSAAWFFSYGVYILSRYTYEHIAFVYVTATFTPLQGFFNSCIYMYPKVKSAKSHKRGQDKVSWGKAISIAFWSKGKETRKCNRARPQTTNLRDGRNRPLRAKKNTNDNDARMIMTPHFFHRNKQTTKDKKTRRREPREEDEEKSEIQPPANMVVSNRHKVSQLSSAPK